jgi:hypothetical protein
MSLVTQCRAAGGGGEDGEEIEAGRRGPPSNPEADGPGRIGTWTPAFPEGTGRAQTVRANPALGRTGDAP